MSLEIAGHLLLSASILASSLVMAQAQMAESTRTAGKGAEQPFVVEYYYTTKWGHAEEFITLFRKNHLPLLKKEIELGRLRSVSITVPRYHTTEEGRWDYRVTIVFPSAAVAADNFDEAALAQQLFPDQETFKREEQRRFEILEAHWDLPVKSLPTD
ncbi:MAG TPA: hypothetical protein VF784_13260 [Anaerolineales bacterium]